MVNVKMVTKSAQGYNVRWKEGSKEGRRKKEERKEEREGERESNSKLLQNDIRTRICRLIFFI